MKCHIFTKLDLLQPRVEDNIYNKQIAQKATHDQKAKYRETDIEDKVVVHDFRTKKSWMSGAVIEKTGTLSAKVKLQNGNIVRRH